MKNLLGISLVALFAAAPMVANAAAVAGSPVSYTTQPTGDARAAVIGGEGEYAGYLVTDYCSSLVLPINGNMAWGEGAEAEEIPVTILWAEAGRLGFGN